jgi:hypothetical protein
VETMKTSATFVEIRHCSPPTSVLKPKV